MTTAFFAFDLVTMVFHELMAMLSGYGHHISCSYSLTDLVGTARLIETRSN